VLCVPQVLDVNGLLIERSITVLRDAQHEPVEPDVRVGAFHVYNRPGLQAFITMLMERFVVGVWSSARQHNLRGLVRHIFGAYEERLAFAWGQEACTYAGTTADSKPLFLKELGRVWAEPAFASFGPHNTLLVDDDAYKAARNPPNTAIHPKKVRRRRRRPLGTCACASLIPLVPPCLSQFSWCGDASDTGLLQHGVLWDYLERLSTQDTVPGFVTAVPFGAPAEPAHDTSPEEKPETKTKKQHSKRRRSSDECHDK